MNKTAENLSRSIASMKEELKADEEAHNTLMSHQQRLLQELEGVQSQIYSSTSIMQVKRRQCALLEVEFKKVASLRHPVRRIPFEILQCIFECASGCSDPNPTLYGIKYAIKLSHVCQRWRSVAIDTPRMWSSIAFSLESHRDKIGIYWNFLASRIKHVSATISIICWDMQSFGRLTACKLPRIQEIKKLSLFLEDPRCFEQLYTLPSFLPEKGVETLAVEASWSSEPDNENNQDNIVWDLGALIAHLPTISSLIIRSPYKISITPSIKFEATTSLTLASVMDVDIPLILSLMINLSDLDVRNADLAATQQVTDHMSCRLRNFVMYRCGGGCPWLSQISFPFLTTIIIDINESPERTVTLMRNHKSVTTIWALNGEDIVSSLASASPQLQTLGMDSGFPWLHKRKIAKIKGTPFPKLRDVLLDTRFQELALTDFEGIVRGRCLPSDHPDGNIMPSLLPLRSLTILRNFESDIPEAWRDSELFHSATQVTTPSPYHADDEEITLKWV